MNHYNEFDIPAYLMADTTDPSIIPDPDEDDDVNPGLIDDEPELEEGEDEVDIEVEEDDDIITGADPEEPDVI